MNDWIVANINNSDFTVGDFHDIADMDVNNTLMLSKDKYLKSDYIKNNPLFLKDGKFSEDLFDKFYKLKLSEFREFQEGNYYSGPALDMYDTRRTAKTPTKNIDFAIGRLIPNPERLQIGIEGVSIFSKPTKSRQEIAQENKIYDYETGKYRDYTPNDKALFNGKHDYGMGWISSLFEDPLVMAQYTEDGEHDDPVTGQRVKHKKGDFKLNEKGAYYYETLGDRSPIGKLVLSALDTISIDGTGINKYDFFDSDDVEKSVGGTIVKNVVALLPLFAGGPISSAYSTFLIARELSKSLPMVYGVASALFTDDDTPNWINKFAAYGEKLTGGTSDYAKEHTFSFENFGNMVADVAVQWGQQKRIAKYMDQLRGTKNYMKEAEEKARLLYESKKATMGAQAAPSGMDWKSSALGQAALKRYMPEAERATKLAGNLGRDASLAYMAIVSNTDVYQDMLAHGATRQEAAAVALGSTLGMYAVDKTGLGELFFDEATEESVKQARRALRKEFDEVRKTAFQGIKNQDLSPAQKLMKYIKIGSEKGKKVMGNFVDDLRYHTTTLGQKMVGEGLEEVSEEAVADAAKSIYEIAGKLGADTSTTDVGAWDNAFERYSMNFLGGAIGGGVFYGKEIWDRGTFSVNKKDEELVTLIRNGHVRELRDVLSDMKRKGKVASTKISGTEYENDDNNDPVWLSASTRASSQNDVIADLIGDKITALDAVINNNQVNLDDDALFRQMVLSESRFAKYQGISHVTNYYQDFNDVLMNLLKAETNYKKAAVTLDGTPDGTIGSDEAMRHLTNELQGIRQNNIKKYADELQLARDKKNAFLSGDTSLDYARKLNFLMDPMLHDQFLGIDEEQIWKEKFGDKRQDEISVEELGEFLQLLQTKRNEQFKTLGTTAFERFKALEKVITPNLGILSENADKFKQWQDSFLKELESGSLNPANIDKWDEDMQLPGEDDEDYAHRNVAFEVNPVNPEFAETEEEFQARKARRKEIIDKHNEEVQAAWAKAVKERLDEVGGVVDPLTYHRLLGPNGVISARAVDMIKASIKSNITNPKAAKILERLNTDMSNASDLIKEIKESAKQVEADKIIEQSEQISKTTLDTEEGDNVSLFDLFSENEDITIGEIINDIQNDELETGAYNLTEESQQALLDTAQFYKERFGENVGLLSVLRLSELQDIISGESEEGSEAFDNFVSMLQTALENTINNTLNIIKSNPIYQLVSSLKGTLHNPIVDIVQALAGKTLDKQDVPNVMETLDALMNDFQNIDDVSELVLDEKQREILEKTKDALKMINTYIYAASANSDLTNPVGHNKVFNEMAKNHSDLVSKWEELPEIDDDYAALYLREISKYAGVLLNWINFANNNDINKRSLFVRSDRAFNKSLWDLMYNLYQNSAFNVEIKDKDGNPVKRNLLDGFSSIDDSLKDDDRVAVPLYNAEKLLYTNFQKVLAESGLSVTEFLEQTKLFDKLIADSLAEQKIAKITDKLLSKDLSAFDRLLYFAQVLTLDPTEFYTSLKAKVKANEKIAPITAQEYGQKLILANRNKQFRDMMGYAFKKTKDDRYAALNTVVIVGSAGAGKTQVVAKVGTDGINSEEILALGPTLTQAKSLRESLGISAKTGLPNTIEEFAKAILGDDIYKELMDEIESTAYSPGKSKTSKQGKFFTFKVSDSGYHYPVLNVDDEGNLYRIADGKRTVIKFKKLPITPKLVAIDEATHIPSPLAQIFDLFQRQNDGQLLLIGDPKQNGYLNETVNALGNIEPSRFFSARAPELDVSLRDNNIQKQYNLSVIKGLLDTIQQKMDGSEEDLNAFWPTALNILKKINFRVYNKDEINGDLITPSLNDDLLAKIKNKKGKIGYIGDKKSATYTQLVNAGLEDGKDFQTLDYKQMQGQEFDYVIIDKDFAKPELNIGIRNTVKDIYTLMSRGREAAIFIDKGISSLVGKNQISEYKAKAPSLLDVIDGKSAVQELREKKLEILNMYDLTPTGIESEATKKKKEETKKKIDEDAAFFEAVKDNPDERPDEVLESGKKLSDVIAEMDKESKQDLEPELEALIDGYSDFSAPASGDVTLLSVNEIIPSEEEGIDFKAPLLPNGEHPKKMYKGDKWIIRKPVNGPLRNLQALIQGDEAEAFWFDSPTGGISKMKLQRWLYQLKSAAIYEHSYRELADANNDLAKLFKEEDWNNRKVKLEIREAEGETLPLFATMDDIGMEINGKKYIANLVLEVLNKDKRTVLIDLAGINNPQTLLNNVDLIKKNIDAKVKSGKVTDPKVLSKLKNIYATIGDRALKYENWVNDKIKAYEAADKSKPFLIDVEPALEFSKTTWFKKRKDVERNGRKERARIRLGGTTNPALIRGGENEEDVRNQAIESDKNINFRTLNPHIVISPVYTYSNKRNALESIDPSVKGKAVVFITSDMLLKPEDLVDEYIQQKKHPLEYKPRVRMLVLGNYGMTFSQFASKDFIKKFQGGDEARKPVRQNFKGIHMYTSMWNARAALGEFIEAVNTWRSENGYDDAKVNAILKADLDWYDAGKPTDVEPFLKANGVTKEEFDSLTNLNLEILKDVPMFRLGYLKTKQGFHIEQRKVSNSKAYRVPTSSRDVKLVSISLKKAETFYKLLNDTFKALTLPKEKHGLNLLLKHEDGSDWKANEYIDIENSKHQRQLSGLLKFSSDTGLIIRTKDELASVEKGEDVYKEIRYTGGDAWSYVPGFLIHMTRRFTALQLELNPSDLTFATTYAYEDGKKTDTELASLQVGLWLKELEPTKFDGNKVVEYDHTLLNMFDLIFHGTTEDIHGVNEKGEKPLIAEDALFKNGFYIDPDAERVLNDDKTDYRTIVIEDENQEGMFMKIGTSEALFDVDVDPRAAGISLNVDRLLGYAPDEGAVEEGDSEDDIEAKEAEYAKAHPATAVTLLSLKEIGVIDSATVDQLDKAADHQNKQTTAIVLDKFASGRDKKLDKVAYFTVENDELVPHTLQEYFQKLLGGVPFTSAKADKGRIIINDEYTIKDGKLEKFVKTSEDKLDEKLKEEEDKKEETGEVTKEEPIWSSEESNTIREHLNELLNSELLKLKTVDDITKILDADDGSSNNTVSNNMKNFLENMDEDELGEIDPDIIDLLSKCAG